PPVAGRAVLRVYLETTPKRTFATAIDWPGWSRSGKTPEAAAEALLAYRARYAAALDGSTVEPPTEGAALDIEERVDGDAGTEFGVPSRIAQADRRPLDEAE